MTIHRLQVNDSVTFYLNGSSLPKQQFEVCFEISTLLYSKLNARSFRLLGSNTYYVPTFNQYTFEFVSKDGVLDG